MTEAYLCAPFIINVFNKFAREIRNERVYIMDSYLAGHLFLVWGFLFFKKIWR